MRQTSLRKRAKREPVRPRAATRRRDPVTAPVETPLHEPPPDPRADGRKRAGWTREAIVNELATWIKSGTEINATFVARYGPPGLVAATRRVFGRFEAALNVAGLQVAKLNPEGPRRTDEPPPSVIRAALRRERRAPVAARPAPSPPPPPETHPEPTPAPDAQPPKV